MRWHSDGPAFWEERPALVNSWRHFVTDRTPLEIDPEKGSYVLYLTFIGARPLREGRAGRAELAEDTVEL